MKTSESLNKIQKRYWIIPIIIFFLPIGLEIFYRDALYNASIPHIISLQSSIRNAFGYVLSKEKIENSKSLGNFFEVVQMLSSNTFFLIFAGLTYNFVNVYKAYLLFSSIFFSNLVSSLLNIVYHVPKPFMVNSYILPLFSANDWGYPNTSLVTMFAFYSTFFNILFKSKDTKDKLWLKIVLGIFLSLLCFGLTFFQFAAGAVTYEQILLSITTGIAIFFALFSIFDAKVNDPKQFYHLIKFRFIYYCAINAIIVAFLIIMYLFIEDKEGDAHYRTILAIQEGRKPTSFLSGIIVNTFALYDGTFVSIVYFLGNVIVMIALKAELYLTFNNNFDVWRKNNFEYQDKQVGVEYSIYTDYSSGKGTQWNHTGALHTVLRFFALTLFSVPGCLPIVFGFLQKYKIINGLFNFGIPMVYLCFGYFFLFKWFCRKIKLANKISTSIQES